MTAEQFEFIKAVDEYKKINSKPFPTWTEVLEVIKALGYRRVAEPQSLERSARNVTPAEATQAVPQKS